MDTPSPALHAAARRRAHQLREAALDEAWRRLVAWLRRRPALRTKEARACHS